MPGSEYVRITDVPAIDHAELEARIGARLDAGDLSGAATEAIRGFGPQILGYLVSIVRDESSASDVFSAFCEDLWRGIGTFRRDASFRTWAYTLAWHAAVRSLRDPFRKRGGRLDTGAAEALANQVRSTTALHLRDTSKEALAKIRANLAPEEQTLLVLRIDQDLSWTEIAHVLAGSGEPPSEAMLRKRFERLKEKLRREAEALGLLPR
jgi:RNA polymerase sigma-70 factor (ECF subfamily)